MNSAKASYQTKGERGCESVERAKELPCDALEQPSCDVNKTLHLLTKTASENLLGQVGREDVGKLDYPRDEEPCPKDIPSTESNDNTFFSTKERRFRWDAREGSRQESANGMSTVAKCQQLQQQCCRGIVGQQSQSLTAHLSNPWYMHFVLGCFLCCAGVSQHAALWVFVIEARQSNDLTNHARLRAIIRYNFLFSIAHNEVLSRNC